MDFSLEFLVDCFHDGVQFKLGEVSTLAGFMITIRNFLCHSLRLKVSRS
jgi:hypothetical protein